MQLLLAIIGIILILFILTPLYAHLKASTTHPVLTILVKGIDIGISVGFAVFGYFMLNKNPQDFHPQSMINNYWILFAIALCMLGDIFLCINFVIGGFLFFLGHIGYIIFFITLGQFHLLSIPIFTLLCVASIIYFYRFTDLMGPLKPLLIGYGTTLAVSLSIGITLPITLGVFGYMPAFAILMLVISDALMARNHFVNETPVTRSIQLGTYFGGQFIMAMSIYIPAVFL